MSELVLDRDTGALLRMKLQNTDQAELIRFRQGEY
jgi:hypothetical protein